MTASVSERPLVSRPPVSRVLLAGTFLSGRGGSRAPIEDLAEKLATVGVRPLCASHLRQPLARVVHLLMTAMIQRNHYEVAVVDLYSGRAFYWGEALSYLLNRLRRPFVLALHGGGLPTWAEKRPGRVRACLAQATTVAAPSRYLLEQLRPYRKDIVLIPNPLNLGDYPFRPRSNAQPRMIWVRAFHSIYN